MSAHTNILALAVAPFSLLILLVLVKHPRWSPTLLLLTATATPWSFGKGLTPSLVLTGVLAVIACLAMIFGRSPSATVAVTPKRMAAAFAATAVISALLGWFAAEQEILKVIQAEWLPVQLGQLAAIALGPAAFLVTARFLTTRRALLAMIVSYVAITTFGMMIGLTIQAFEVNLRGLVLTWSAALILGQLLFNEDLGKPIRALLVGILGVTLFVKFALGLTWVSGWLPTVVAFAVITAIRWRKSLAVFAVVAVLGFAYAGDTITADYDREYNESGGSRLNKWTLVTRQPFVQDHLAFGTGPANYAVYFAVYTPGDRMSTHNNYLDIFLQLGLVGISLLFLLLFSVSRLGLRLSASSMDPFMRAFVRSVLGGVAAVAVAMALGDWFTPFVFNQGLAGFSWTVQSWIFMGALCAVPVIIRNEAPVGSKVQLPVASSPVAIRPLLNAPGLHRSLFVSTRRSYKTYPPSMRTGR